MMFIDGGSLSSIPAETGSPFHSDQYPASSIASPTAYVSHQLVGLRRSFAILNQFTPSYFVLGFSRLYPQK
jgi:hypothetical protein